MAAFKRRAPIPQSEAEIPHLAAENIMTAVEGAQFRELSADEMAVLLDILKRNRRSLMSRAGV